MLRHRWTRPQATLLAAATLAAGLALAPPSHADTSRVLLYGLTNDNRLVHVRADAPGTVLNGAGVLVTGLIAGDDLVGMDVRPATGELVGLVNGTSVDRLVLIDPDTGVTTPIAPLSTALRGTVFGVDVDPVRDRLRVVSHTEQNLLVDLRTGAVEVQPDLAYAADDRNAGRDPGVRGVGFTSNVAGAATTLQYGYDASGSQDRLVLHEADTGTIRTVANSGVNVVADAPGLAVVGLDVEAVTDLGYAVLADTHTVLYRTDGPIGGAAPLVRLGDLPDGMESVVVASPRFSLAPTARGPEGGSAQVTVTRSGDAGSPATVTLRPSTGGTASAGDFSAADVVVSFAAGERSKTGAVPLTADAATEPEETFRVSIVAVRGSGNEAATALNTATVTIEDRAAVTPSPSTSPSSAPPSASPSSAAPSASPSSAAPSASPSPPPSASPSGSASPGCTTPASVTLERTSIAATTAAGVVVRATPGSIVDLFAYSRPSTTFRAVRAARLGSAGEVRFSVTPPTNTRLFARQRGCTASPSVVLNVRTQLTLTVVRTGSRTYRFAGDSLPARPGGLIVSLYRVTADGGQVLAGQARADALDGEWSLLRRFTGSGRFGFVVRTGQDLQNAPGSSNVRSLLVF